MNLHSVYGVSTKYFPDFGNGCPLRQRTHLNNIRCHQIFYKYHPSYHFQYITSTIYYIYSHISLPSSYSTHPPHSSSPPSSSTSHSCSTQCILQNSTPPSPDGHMESPIYTHHHNYISNTHPSHHSTPSIHQLCR